MRRFLAPLTAALFAFAILVPAAPLAAAERVHKVVIHVDDNDPARMNLALNNAANVDAYYKEKAEEVVIEIVAYGPGLHMLRADTSPVKDRIKSFRENFDNISFRACANTQARMMKAEKKDIPIVPEGKMVPSGVIHLIRPVAKVG
jgi:hypothetical protein